MLRSKRPMPYPRRRHHQWQWCRFLIVLFAALSLTGGIGAYFYRKMWFGNLETVASTTSYETLNIPTTTPTPASITQAWPLQLSYYQADSYTVVVNKKHQLPADYVPSDLVDTNNIYLRAYVANAMQNLIDAAWNNNFHLKIVSDYRSYSDQEAVYNGYVAVDGQAVADTYSARPGFSEHQTGLAADIGITNGECVLLTCFGNTPAGQWIAANAAEFGFIIRYPEGKEDITGYQYEPWHLRYVGITIAKAVVASGLTLDEYFGIIAGDYQ